MIYLDNSATTYPKPKEVRYAVANALTHYGANPGRSGYQMSLATSQMIYQTRKRLADFFHMAHEENVIFTPSCTCSLNMVIKGVLQKGDHVIISSLEHNSVVRPLEKLKRKGVITYSVAKVYEKDDEKTLHSFRDCINEKTRIMVVTHASNVFGIRLPIERLCALSHQYHILFCVDAAQSAGVLPIDIMEYDYDFVCCAGHKGLMGVMGSGLLLVNHDALSDTIIEGGTGSQSSDRILPSYLPDRLESGTGNVPGICAMGAGAQWISRINRERIFQKEIRHIQTVYRYLSEMRHVLLFTDEPDEAHYAPVLSFCIKDMDSESVSKYLDEKYGICVRAGLHCAPLAHQFMGTGNCGTVRISPSYLTSDNEIRILIEAIHKISNLA